MLGNLFSGKKGDLSEAVELSPLPAFVVDSTAQIVVCNEQFRTMLNDQVQKENLLEKIFECDAGGFAEKLSAFASSNDERLVVDVKIIGDKEKTAKIHLKKISAELAEENGKTYFFANLVDTQEQKSLELKLNHSQKMQAVGQLAGGIAHDFNNLLTAMSGFCDLLLQKHPPGDRSFPDIMQIKQNVNRAANLVRQLLAFSRKQVMKAQVIDITDNLSELSNLLRRLLGESISLDIKHGRDLGRILADGGQIDQVTINLAVNARDAMPQGGSLTIETESFEADQDMAAPSEFYTPDSDEKILSGSYVMIKITDTGTGMPRDVLDKIFEPFFSTKEVGAGTGLGLATVYGIVKQFGGYILVKSVEGEGTEFRILLKTHDGEIPAEESKEEESPVHSSADLTGVGTILLVEDEVPVRIFASRALTNKGYKVIEADNAEMAFEQIEENKDEIDLIISDVIMPGMNGPEMVNKIKEENPDLKVIFISGYTEDAFIDFCNNPEDLVFLPKPFTLKELASKVKEVMG